jgi:4-hydroxy-tetrahydrodipicolinate synthase
VLPRKSELVLQRYCVQAEVMTLTGLFIPLITPFDASGRVDLASLESVAYQVLEEGAAGLVALGTTGEPSSLTEEEKQAVIEVAGRVCRERGAPLVVGAACVQELRALAARQEVAAALTVVPPFVRPGEAGVLAYFARLAAAGPVPLVVYHVPYRTGQPLSVGALRDLAALPGVCGMKYAAGFDATTVALLADPPPGVAILGGDDIFVSPMLALGAHGGILASAHVATARYARLVRAWREGEVARARGLGHRLAALSAALFAEPNPAVIKAVLHAEGRIKTPGVRLPLLAATSSNVDTARLLLDRALQAGC